MAQSQALISPAADVAPERHSAPFAGAAAYAGRRLLSGLLTLLAIAYVSRFGLAMAAGAAPGQAARASVEATAAYLGRLARGDAGLSSAGSTTVLPVPVSAVLPRALGQSLGLMLAAIAFATLVGVTLGLVAAVRRRSGRSMLILLASIAGVSVPSFFLALLLQLAVLRLTRLAGRTVLPVGGSGWDAHIILPMLVLAARPIAQITRVTFVSVGEVLAQDYVRTATGKGVPGPLLLGRHVMRNAAVPVLTTVGLSLRFALSSLPVVEFFFGWPGAGYVLLKAIARLDADLTTGLVLALGLLFILVNLLLELGYRLLDPRLRRDGTQVRHGGGAVMLGGLRSLLGDLADVAAGLPFAARLLRRDRPPLPALPTATTPAPAPAPAVRRLPRLEPVLLAGLLILAGLAVVYALGPRLAPHSPYTVRTIEWVDGKITAPPFAPGAEYPWGTDVLGRDMLSLILAGARQTLSLALVAVAARLAVGALLGAAAGWLRDSRADRLLLSLVEVMAAYPALLLAMTLVLAFGIRNGTAPFVIALCFVGWGEVMQLVRGQVLAIRPRQYIEGAVAVGARTPRILARHVLPNLLPSLISLAALEMGSVLMLLGELGFVGIFIGGGAFAEVTVDEPLYHFSDVAEWGALLSNVRPYARSYTWTAFYPALAFFVAILGFNLFGEGLRRLVEERGLNLGRLFNRYTLAVAVVAGLGLVWLRANGGAAAYYRPQALTFSGEQALAHAAALAGPGMEGRALGSGGLTAAGDYVAARFAEIGLQAGGEDFTYFQTRARGYTALSAVPLLAIDDGGDQPVYRRDYREYFGGYRALGSLTAPVRLVAMGPLTEKGRALADVQEYWALSEADFSDEIVLALSEADATRLAMVPRGGLLIVSDDTARFALNTTLSPDMLRGWTVAGVQALNVDRPVMYITEALADRILAPTGRTVAGLRRLEAGLGRDDVVTLATNRTVSMGIAGEVREAQVRHVVGHLPGRSADWDERLVVVLAQYDAAPSAVDGGGYPGANDNASGVAVMLEAARAMQESGYQPYKTFLFIAYSGEGLEGGRPMSEPEVAEFLKAKYGFSSAFTIDAVVDLRGLGAGTGDGLAISAGGNQRLAAAFEDAARRLGVPIRREREAADLSVVFDAKSFQEGGQEAPRLRLTWDGWQATSRLPSDTVATLSADKLERAGRTLALALMMLGRDTSG